MQIIVLFTTIGVGIYFMMFNRESPIAMTLTALSPLGFGALFLVRFFSEKKKRKQEEETSGKPQKKKFKDPNDFLKENS